MRRLEVSVAAQWDQGVEIRQSKARLCKMSCKKAAIEMLAGRSVRLLSLLLPRALNHRRNCLRLLSQAPATPVGSSDSLKGNCCGNGCHDCVLIDINDAENQDYFAKIEAEIAAPCPPNNNRSAT